MSIQDKITKLYSLGQERWLSGEGPLPEHMSLDPGSMLVGSQLPVTPSPMNLTPFPGLRGHRCNIHTHTHIKNFKLKKVTIIFW